MRNNLLEYYREHNILPENQNVESIERHYARRKKLYRQCGVPELAFRDADILEVGPGGGHNALAFFHWNCRHIDFVEPSSQGIEMMKQLFSEQKIPENRYSLHECTIEKYDTKRKYDIIIAEGVLTILDNQEEIIGRLKSLINENGIIIITCTDKIGFFIERIKKLVGTVLTQNIVSYEEKVKYLTGIFSPQLERLRGVSKLPEDWVKDNMLVPSEQNERELSLARAIRYFQDDFDILGTSPHMFTDYSWSKDIWYDYKKEYIEQFEEKRMTLLMANMPETVLPIEQSRILVKCFEDINTLETEYERTKENNKISRIVEIMDSMESVLQRYFSEEFMKVFNEIKEVLLCIETGREIFLEKYPHFFAAFGRTQQYISFARNRAKDNL